MTLHTFTQLQINHNFSEIICTNTGFDGPNTVYQMNYVKMCNSQKIFHCTVKHRYILVRIINTNFHNN